MTKQVLLALRTLTWNSYVYPIDFPYTPVRSLLKKQLDHTCKTKKEVV